MSLIAQVNYKYKNARSIDRKPIKLLRNRRDKTDQLVQDFQTQTIINHTYYLIRLRNLSYKIMVLKLVMK